MKKTLETDNQSATAPVILRIQQVQARIGLRRSSIYAKLNPRNRYFDASFPQAIRISIKSVGWLESEISAWIATRVIASRSESANKSNGGDHE